MSLRGHTCAGLALPDNTSGEATQAASFAAASLLQVSRCRLAYIAHNPARKTTGPAKRGLPHGPTHCWWPKACTALFCDENLMTAETSLFEHIKYVFPGRRPGCRRLRIHGSASALLCKSLAAVTCRSLKRGKRFTFPPRTDKPSSLRASTEIQDCCCAILASSGPADGWP